MPNRSVSRTGADRLLLLPTLRQKLCPVLASERRRRTKDLKSRSAVGIQCSFSCASPLSVIVFGEDQGLHVWRYLDLIETPGETYAYSNTNTNIHILEGVKAKPVSTGVSDGASARVAEPS